MVCVCVFCRRWRMRKISEWKKDYFEWKRNFNNGWLRALTDKILIYSACNINLQIVHLCVRAWMWLDYLLSHLFIVYSMYYTYVFCVHSDTTLSLTPSIKYSIDYTYEHNNTGKFEIQCHCPWKCFWYEIERRMPTWMTPCICVRQYEC